MIIGYARVSTDEQRLDMQLSALKEAGCEKIYQDQGATGANMERQGLDAVLKALTPGDTLVVWRLDRLGRSLTVLVKFIEDLGEAGCEFRSLNEAIDTSTSGGRLIFHIMAAFAEFERNLISERTRAGLVAARKRGRRLGRPPIQLSEFDIESARRAICEKRKSLREIAARYRVSPSTLRRRLNAIRAAQPDPTATRARATTRSTQPKPPSPTRMQQLCTTFWITDFSQLRRLNTGQEPDASYPDLAGIGAKLDRTPIRQVTNIVKQGPTGLRYQNSSKVTALEGQLVEFHRDVTLSFHRELTHLEIMRSGSWLGQDMAVSLLPSIKAFSV